MDLSTSTASSGATLQPHADEGILHTASPTTEKNLPLELLEETPVPHTAQALDLESGDALGCARGDTVMYDDVVSVCSYRG
ncbi:hypothetical protein A0H81_13090 [Grifola frondosa]|uniref:Uncharacterized protein n=1 Tax=Grifola frondosa TaxID=5627 RepID=A0A1C7LRJ1_GRIFR|nr:hypothetical protein A0H81_13090 [Grifola frondosa]